MKSKDGFTLLEMLVSVALIALVSVVLSQVFITTLRSNTKTEALKEVKQNGDGALESIVRMVQNAQGVTCPTPQSLAIVNPDGYTTTLACSANSSGTMRLASSSATATVYLSSERVSLGGDTCSASTLQFSCDAVSGLPSRVSVSFWLSQAGTSGDQLDQASEFFQTNVIMRNSP